MDFDSLLRIFAFLLIPIIFKSMTDKKKIQKKQETIRAKRGSIEETQSFDTYESQIPTKKLYNKPNEKQMDNIATSNYTSFSDADKNIETNKIETNYNYDNPIESTSVKTEIVKRENPSFDIKFSNEDIVRAIIMSEILSKPKSLQKR